MLKQFLSWLKSFNPLLKSLAIVAAFSPWLVLFYLPVQNYSANLLDVNDRDIIKQFIEWFGTAYSLFLALALVRVWGQFEMVEREFDREVDAIATLYRTAKYTRISDNGEGDDESNKFDYSIRRYILEYVKHVIENYQIEYQVPQQRSNGEKYLEEIGTKIGSLAHDDRLAIAPLVSELIRNLNEAMDVRGDRISHSKQRTPGIIQLVSIVSSAIWLFSFFTLVLYDPRLSIAMIGGVTFVIIMVIVIFFDLDNPFGGIWKISLDSWNEFLESIDPTPHIIFVYNIENTIIDRAQALLGMKMCKLKSFSRSGFLGNSWRKFLDDLQRISGNTNRKIRCSVKYSDEYFAGGYYKWVKDKELPLVVLQSGEKFDELMNHLEINLATRQFYRKGG
jgi:hypothetical protein